MTSVMTRGREGGASSAAAGAGDQRLISDAGHRWLAEHPVP
jgi:hypothetical protein